MTHIDWTLLGVYLIAVARMGARLARRQTNTEAYFIGGRSISWRR